MKPARKQWVQLVPKFENVFVVAPSFNVSGGPECLHQLVHILRKLGANAFISYWPLRVETPERYRIYDVATAKPVDKPGSLIVLPETLTQLARDYRRAEVAIWWLSVDNNYSSQSWKAKTRWLLALRGNSRALTDRELKKVHNLAQSAYAADHLAQKGIDSHPLCDFINDDYGEEEPGVTKRIDAIAYNPLKGQETTQRLMAGFPYIEWLAIQNMSPAQVRGLLERVKLYVDFGAHPGKDRIPREAALCGACVVVGRKGAAAFAEDVPVDAAYRLDEEDPAFEDRFGDLVKSIFSDFERHRRAFEDYRRIIHSDRARFTDQVRSFFFKPNS